MNILFLNDNNDRTKDFKRHSPSAVTVETAKECIDKLKGGMKFDFLFLDHDLGDEVFVDSKREDCGMEVVRWMVENKQSVGHVVVHTLNHPASKIMVGKLRSVGYQTTPLPFVMFNQSNIYSLLKGD